MSLMEEKKQKRNRRILDVAQVLFEERGFNETTMNMIAQRAELGVGTLYNYYSSKHDILVRIFRESLDGVIKAVNDRQYRSREPVSLTMEYIEAYMDNIKSFNKRLLMESSMSLISDPGILEQSLELNALIIRTNEEFFTMMEEKKHISSGTDIRAAALLLFSIMKIKALSYVYSGEEEASALYDVRSMIHILFNGIKPKETP